MQILILTLDGVGSTLLQRLVTLCLRIENVNVINTHELTNGLKLDSGKVLKDFRLGYGQSLTDITDILSAKDQNLSLVSRLAEYHLDRRKDPLDQKKKFFSFLNRFYDKKIMCVRKNVFEQAMSMSISAETDILNIYNKRDKTKVNQLNKVNEDVFIQQCINYVKYIEWVEKNFNTVTKVFYEDLVTNTDSVCENITGYKDTFKNKFSSTMASILKIERKYTRPMFLGEELVGVDKKELQTLVHYRGACKSIIRGEMGLDVPVKNTTLLDKKNQIANFNNCLDKFYSFAKNYNWIDQSIATYDFISETHVC